MAAACDRRPWRKSSKGATLHSLSALLACSVAPDCGMPPARADRPRAFGDRGERAGGADPSLQSAFAGAGIRGMTHPRVPRYLACCTTNLRVNIIVELPLACLPAGDDAAAMMHHCGVGKRRCRPRPPDRDREGPPLCRRRPPPGGRRGAAARALCVVVVSEPPGCLLAAPLCGGVRASLAASGVEAARCWARQGLPLLMCRALGLLSPSHY